MTGRGMHLRRQGKDQGSRKEKMVCCRDWSFGKALEQWEELREGKRNNLPSHTTETEKKKCTMSKSTSNLGRSSSAPSHLSASSYSIIERCWMAVDGKLHQLSVILIKPRSAEEKRGDIPWCRKILPTWSRASFAFLTICIDPQGPKLPQIFGQARREKKRVLGHEVAFVVSESW